MKRINLLSRSEMKTVNGGRALFGGCTSDSQCPSGQSCCPDLANSPGSTLNFACTSPGPMTLPDGTVGMDNCPS